MGFLRFGKKSLIFIFLFLYLIVLSFLFKNDSLNSITTTKTIFKTSNLEKKDNYRKEISFNGKIQEGYIIPVSLNEKNLLNVFIKLDNTKYKRQSFFVKLQDDSTKTFLKTLQYKISKGKYNLFSTISYKNKDNKKLNIVIFGNLNTPKIEKISITKQDVALRTLNKICYGILAFLYTGLIFLLFSFLYLNKDKILSLKNIAIFFFIFLIITLIIGLLYNNFSWDFSKVLVAFSQRDDTEYMSIAKNAMDGNNFWSMPNIGYPFGTKRYNFPMLVAFYFGYCRVCGIFTNNIILVNNFYFLLTLFLSTFTFVLLGRKLKINYPFCILGGICFSFSQYHFFRRIEHITATSYFVVPLVLYLCLKIFNDKKINDKFLSLKNKLSLYSPIILICFLLGSTDIFYAYFGLFLLSLSLMCALFKKRYVAFYRGVIINLIIILFLFSNLYPSILNTFLNGATTTVLRTPKEAFFYSLMFVHLFLPMNAGEGHIFYPLYKSYMESTFFKNEAMFSYMGIFGCIGFLILLLVLFFDNISKFFKRLENKEDKGSFKAISSLVMFAFLLGTCSGIGPMIALMGFTKVRTYNRISVYILALSILSFIYFLDIIFKKYIKNKKYIGVIICVISIVFCYIHFVDINLKSFIHDYKKVKEKIENRKDFAKKISLHYKPNSNILELPIISYPENSLGNRTQHVSYYLFTKDINYSYGTLSHTDEYLWQRKLFNINNVQEVVYNAKRSNFDAVLVDTELLSNANVLIEKLKRIIGEPLFRDKEKKVFLFDLKKVDINKVLEEIDVDENLIIDNDFVVEGFGGLKNSSGKLLRWGVGCKVDDLNKNCKNQSVLKYIVKKNRPYKIKINLLSKYPNKAKIYINDNFIKKFDIQKGRNLLKTDAIIEKQMQKLPKLMTLRIEYENSVIPKGRFRNLYTLTARYKAIKIVYR